MKRQSGITMVALIITIVMMLILAGVTVTVSIDGKLFGTTKKVVSDAQKQEEMDLLKTAVYMCLNDETEIDDMVLLKSKLPNGWNTEKTTMGEIKVISPNGNKFVVDNEGEIKDKFVVDNEGEIKNEYGFYYDVEYVCRDYFGTSYPSKVTTIILEDGTLIVNTYQEKTITEGSTFGFEDIMGYPTLTIPSVEYNKKYKATGVLNSQCTYYLDSNGYLHGENIIPKENIIYSDKTMNLGGAVSAIFTEDGKSFGFGGKTFSIEN